MIKSDRLIKIGGSILLLLMIVACGSNGAETADPDAVPIQATPIDDSPRGAATPDPGLPPTWTPAPLTGDGHVFDVRGEDSEELPVEITGTRTIYIVQRGDTLGEIAERFGVSLADLARANNIDNINIIEVGDELVIP